MPCWKLSLTWVSQISGGLWPAQHFLLSGASQIRDFVDLLGTFYSLGHPKFEILLTRSALSTLWTIPNSEFRWLAQCFPSSRVSQTSISVTSSSTFSFLSHPGSQFSLTCLALSHSLVTLDLDFRWLAQYFLLPGASQTFISGDLPACTLLAGHPRHQHFPQTSPSSAEHPPLTATHRVRLYHLPGSSWFPDCCC